MCTWRTPNFQPCIGDFLSDQPVTDRPRWPPRALAESNVPQQPTANTLHLLYGPLEVETICHSETLRADSTKNCNQRLRDPKILRQEGLEEPT